MSTLDILFLSKNSAMTNQLLRLAALLSFASLVGCATGPDAHPRDPMEPLNRAVYGFNQAVDEAVLKPAASAYESALPQPARAGVSNFFSNIGDVWSVVNNALQGKGKEASDSFARVLINSTLGVAGLFDIASGVGIERHKQDFGQTLGHWGMGSGPYLVLPLLGSSTLRDAAALPIDYKGDLSTHIHSIPLRNSATGLRLVDERSALLGASNLLDEAALDKYSFTRDAHLQRRDGSIAGADNAAPDADPATSSPNASPPAQPH